MRRRPPAAVLLLAFAACSSSPTLPEGAGRGMIAYDASPPDGARTWPRPELKVGDALTLVRGGVARRKFTVVRADEQRYVLEGDDGVQLHRDRDLGNLGEWPNDSDEPLHLLSPVDARFHWPLWLGKRWRCEFVDKLRTGQALPIVASYVVEDVDTIAVPAGTFQALRILRTAKLAVEGQSYVDRTMVIWYAPEIGLEVRQILGDTMVELVEWSRGSGEQPAGAPAKSATPASAPPANAPPAPSASGPGS